MRHGILPPAAVAAFTIATIPNLTGSGSECHPAVTNANSASADTEFGPQVKVLVPLLPDLLPPDSKLRTFSEENRECSSPSGGTSIFAAPTAGAAFFSDTGGRTGGPVMCGDTRRIRWWTLGPVALTVFCQW